MIDKELYIKAARNTIKLFKTECKKSKIFYFFIGCIILAIVSKLYRFILQLQIDSFGFVKTAYFLLLIILLIFSFLVVLFCLHLIYTKIFAFLYYFYMLLLLLLCFTLLIHFMNFFCNRTVSAYIALSLCLTIISIYPQIIFTIYKTASKIIFKIINLLSCITKLNLNNLSDIDQQLKNSSSKFKPKLFIYFISILITVFTTIEKLSDSPIISLKYWLQIKPVIFESVITMIVIDRFMNLLRQELKISHNKNVTPNKADNLKD